eukprot:CAMPEP_0202980094 /NCGR_PEP_ID=MMETSP1396-20130829/86087_1 /ASSEMBLY_ACC=CAM_ASM_000872 /TAXON_ID= /ORGANISM="Pseudokeronopsis sp., Strain Brazil" /LENGTH=55 /DNA_ID=CAMNT_0049719859 /DNA_START=926 /DNA_END=1089 /DNA_ORIENTATION=-
MKATDIDRDYRLLPGHKAVIMHMRVDEDKVVTADKKGALKVMEFGVFKSELAKGP